MSSLLRQLIISGSILLLLLTGGLVAPLVSLAADGHFLGSLSVPGTGSFQPSFFAPTFPLYAGGGPFSLQDIIDVATEIRNFVLIVAVVIVVTLFVVAVLRFILARGDARAAAFGSLAVVVIGAALVLGVFPILNTLRQVLTERTLFGDSRPFSSSNQLPGGTLFRPDSIALPDDRSSLSPRERFDP